MKEGSEDKRKEEEEGRDSDYYGPRVEPGRAAISKPHPHFLPAHLHFSLTN